MYNSDFSSFKGFFYKKFLNSDPSANKFDTYIKNAVYAHKFPAFKILVNEKIKRMGNPKQPKFNKNLMNVIARNHKYLGYVMNKGYKSKNIQILFEATATLNKNAVRCAEELINSGNINVNQKVNGLYTALWNAARIGNYEIVHMLIRKGAKLNIQMGKTFRDKSNILGQTALHAAALNGHARVVKLLIQRGADINIKDANGDTPLKVALKKYTCETSIRRNFLMIRRDTVEELLKEHIKKNNNVSKNLDNSKNYDGSSPLYSAAWFGDIDMLKLLLKAGANVNVQVSKNTKTPDMNRVRGSTPLHIASCKGLVETVKYLIEQGADINIRDSKGVLPIEIAVIERRPNVVKLLFEQHVKNNTVGNININKGYNEFNKLFGNYYKKKHNLKNLISKFNKLSVKYIKRNEPENQN